MAADTKASRMRLNRDSLFVLVVGVLAGLCLTAWGLSPTGSSGTDTVVLVAGAVAVVWCASSAPWWLIVVVAATAGLLASGAAALALTLLAIMAASYSGLRSARARWAAPIAVALVVQVLACIREFDRFGVSSAVGVSLAAVLVIAGLVVAPRARRRPALLAGAVAALFLLVAGIGVAAAGAGAAGNVSDGVDRAKVAVEYLGDGDFDEARVAFAAAAADLRAADTSLSRPWSQLSRLVPVVAQYRAAGGDLVHAAASAATDVAAALDQIDPDALRVVEGRIDIESVRALRAPLEQMMASLDALAQSAKEVDNPWLVDSLTERIDELTVRIDDKLPTGQKLVDAITELPNMLGADRPRRYFIAFTTPVEARGLGGFMGNWVEVVLDQGKIDVTKFGRHNDLNETGVLAKRVRGPADFLQTWGDRGFVGADGRARNNIWSDVTMSPNFPAVADVVRQLYPQSSGGELDGVFAMDLYTLAGIMSITGPVEVPQAGVTIDTNNAAQFLLHDQYVAVENRPDRVDALEFVAKTTIGRLLSQELPPPQDLARLLAPFVRDGRFVGWAKAPSEQALFETLGGDGALPDPGDGDGIAVAFNGAGLNKIDYFLHPQLRYELSEPGDGQVQGVMTLQLENRAPTTGEPAYIIVNNNGKPVGTSDLYVTVYGQLPIRSITVNGVATPFKASVEAGYQAGSFFVATPSMQASTIVVTFAGQVADPTTFTSSITVRTPPLTNPMPTSVGFPDGTERSVDHPGRVVVEMG
jgi:hypothetical protein